MSNPQMTTLPASEWATKDDQIEAWRSRAEAAEAERDRLNLTLAEIRNLANRWSGGLLYAVTPLSEDGNL